MAQNKISAFDVGPRARVEAEANTEANTGANTGATAKGPPDSASPVGPRFGAAKRLSRA